MTDFERINEPRVERILETLELIAKSARSNRLHGAFEHASILRPVFDAVTEIGAQDVRPAPAAPPAEDEPAPIARERKTSIWPDVRSMAEEAPLKDLTVAMAVYLGRIDQELFARKEQGQ